LTNPKDVAILFMADGREASHAIWCKGGHWIGPEAHAMRIAAWAFFVPRSVSRSIAER